MNNALFINWQTFKAKLQQHPQLVLQFKYADGKYVDASYHITEIKHAPITSVDCGGVINHWTETIIQLWEPATHDAERAMQVSKALSIIAIVETKLELHAQSMVKIEFGNSQFDTRQMYPGEFSIDGEDLVVSLVPDFTRCKATDRGGSCGTDDKNEDCCTPAVAEKTKN
jgi:hypothetical protein